MMIAMMFRDSDDEQWITSRSFTKMEIEEAVRSCIERHLEYTDSGRLYLAFKELEYVVKVGREALKEGAFDSIGWQLEGETSGNLLGHGVEISYPYEWHFSPSVEELKDRQKRELRELQERGRPTALRARHRGREGADRGDIASNVGSSDRSPCYQLDDRSASRNFGRPPQHPKCSFLVGCIQFVMIESLLNQ
jgi:hypothetical protein